MEKLFFVAEEALEPSAAQYVAEGQQSAYRQSGGVHPADLGDVSICKARCNGDSLCVARCDNSSM